MKFYPLQLFVILFISVVFSACNWLDSNTSSTTTSSNATFVSLRFSAANTADANVAKASFSLVREGVDSIIVNLDSLPVNTAIDSVIPTFSFRSSSAVYAVRKDDSGNIKDSVLLSGKDTLNFNNIVRITNVASDEKTKRSYSIKVNVHKVEPELYQWSRKISQIYTHQGALQKALMLNNTIYFFNSTGLSTSLYKSSNGTDWTSRTLISDLPDNVLLQNMVTFNNKFYLIHNDSLLYSSGNGVDWTKAKFQNQNFNYKNLLYDFKGKLWALAENKSTAVWYFATSTDGVSWEIDLITKVDTNFPVGGFAALAFASRTKQPKVLVAGGYNKDGMFLKNVWSSQDGLYWVDFSKENSTYGYRTGASIVYYEDKLLMFGGVDENSKMQSSLYLQSLDEGLSWKNIDTTYMQVREKYSYTEGDKEYSAYAKYTRRYNQSVIVDNDKFIYLIGGRDSIPQIYTDVWKGRLNKAVFIRK